MRTRVFHRWLAKAGLEKRGLHDIRHSYATLRIQAGDNIADVSRQLGHADIKTTIILIRC
ncbi:MAG: tyrosine-type recombinase/integrase [Desulfobacterales bacterium]